MRRSAMIVTLVVLVASCVGTIGNYPPALVAMTILFPLYLWTCYLYSTGSNR